MPEKDYYGTKYTHKEAINAIIDGKLYCDYCKKPITEQDVKDDNATLRFGEYPYHKTCSEERWTSSIAEAKAVREAMNEEDKINNAIDADLSQLREWRKGGYVSHFYKSLFEAIGLADERNREFFKTGFPHIMEEYYQ